MFQYPLVGHVLLSYPVLGDFQHDRRRGYRHNGHLLFYGVSLFHGFKEGLVVQRHFTRTIAGLTRRIIQQDLSSNICGSRSIETYRKSGAESGLDLHACRHGYQCILRPDKRAGIVIHKPEFHVPDGIYKLAVVLENKGNVVSVRDVVKAALSQSY